MGLDCKSREIYGSLLTPDLAVSDEVKGSVSSSVVNKGVLMADSFITDGVVLMAKETEFVIGEVASRTKYLLAKPHVTKRIRNAGIEIPLAAKEALQNQGCTGCLG